MREGQHFCWQQLPVTVHPVLPGALPVLRWLADERQWSGEITELPLDPATGTRLGA